MGEQKRVRDVINRKHSESNHKFSFRKALLCCGFYIDSVETSIFIYNPNNPACSAGTQQSLQAAAERQSKLWGQGESTRF